jgi:nucleotide-binding universal stress UspA family protein
VDSVESIGCRSASKGRNETEVTAMAKRILLPVQRGDTATAALPVVAALARGAGATVRLINVAPVPPERIGPAGRVIAYASQEMERVEFKRLEGLKEAQAQLEGVPTETVVRFGDPAEEILREAEAFGADLVVMASGARGWRGHLFGGVADRVFDRSEVPVLLLGAR